MTASALDVSCHYDTQTLRPIPNCPQDMAQAVQADLSLANDPQTSQLTQVKVMGRAGIYLAILGQYEQGKEWLLKALQLYGEQADGQQMALELRLGQVYQWQQQYHHANPLFEQAIHKCRTFPQLFHYLDFALQHAGKCWFEQGHNQQAMIYFREALRLRAQKGDAELLASTRQALATVENKTHESPASMFLPFTGHK